MVFYIREIKKEIMEKVNILGIDIDKVNMSEAVGKCVEKIENKEKFFVVTPNAEIIVKASKNEGLFKIINSADLAIPDGIGLVIASKILNNPLMERVTGIDLMTNLLDYADKKKKKIFLLGGAKNVANQAAKKIKENYPSLIISGTMHGYYNRCDQGQEESEVIKLINETKPDMLFVGLGCPLQEEFIAKYQGQINSYLFMVVGGSLDVISGNIKRAPKFYQENGLEWLYRIIKEPTRLKRSLTLPIFVFKVLLKKINNIISK